MTMRTVSSLSTELKTRIENRQAQVAIIGLGYVGLPLALLYTEQKLRVTGFDIDQRKVDTLNAGGSYIFRITPEEISAAIDAAHKAFPAWSKTPVVQRCKVLFKFRELLEANAQELVLLHQSYFFRHASQE